MGIHHTACGQPTRDVDNSGPDGQDAAADGVVLEDDEVDDDLLEVVLLSFLGDELSEPLLESLFASDFVSDLDSPFGTAPARLSVR